MLPTCFLCGAYDDVAEARLGKLMIEVNVCLRCADVIQKNGSTVQWTHCFSCGDPINSCKCGAPHSRSEWLHDEDDLDCPCEACQPPLPSSSSSPMQEGDPF